MRQLAYGGFCPAGYDQGSRNNALADISLNAHRVQGLEILPGRLIRVRGSRMFTGNAIRVRRLELLVGTVIRVRDQGSRNSAIRESDQGSRNTRKSLDDESSNPDRESQRIFKLISGPKEASPTSTFTCF